MNTSSRVPSRLIITAVLLAMVPQGFAADASAWASPLVKATNPDPARLPSLSLWQEESRNRGVKLPMVAAAFPNVPEFNCDSWCYESEVVFVRAEALDGGKLKLVHRIREHPQALLITMVTPEPGAVEIVARAELDKERYPTGKLPADLLTPNLCWQLRRAALFKSKPDPYPEFVKRCFIFTERGMTFLHQTTRRPIPVRASEDPYNNPPWVQMYVGDWQPLPVAGTNSWADYSPDRYTTTLIGAVSRDGKYLAALGSDSPPTMCQAWHDCVHNNPQWTLTDAPPEKRVWRMKIYVMQNDPAALLDRFAKDFPKARRHHGPTQPIQTASPAPSR